MPRVSIIVPVFNVEQYVQEAIKSAISQTYEDREIIVVNDGSTDGTAGALEPFLHQITYLEQPNSGPAAARNRALSVATGEFVALLDGDDYWAAQKLEKCIQYLTEVTDTSMVAHDASLIAGGSSLKRSFYASRPARLRFRSDNQPYWILQYNFLLGPTVVCSRRIFDEFGPLNEKLRYFDDWDMWVRAITGGERAGILNERLCHYRIRSNSVSSNPIDTYVDELSILESAELRPASSGAPGLTGRISFVKGKVALAAGDTVSASRHFRAAARDDQLPPGTRLRAVSASVVPELAWNIYRSRKRKR